MLSPLEFGVGTLADAHPLSLILPRTQYEQPILIGSVDGKPTAVFIGDQHEYGSFPCENNTSWKGLLITGIAVEVDESTAFNPEVHSAPRGALVRQDSTLAIASTGERFMGQMLSVILVEDLIPTSRGTTAGFLRWQIVIGQGNEKRVLKVIDLLLKKEG
jgi:hypothetical protein